MAGASCRRVAAGADDLTPQAPPIMRSPNRKLVDIIHHLAKGRRGASAAANR
jgi:hypothetical protein